MKLLTVAVLFLASLALTSGGGGLAGADGERPRIWYRVEVTFRLTRQVEEQDPKKALHVVEWTSSGSASGVASVAQFPAGTLDFFSYLTGRYTAHSGRGVVSPERVVDGKMRSCTASLQETFKRPVNLTGNNGSPFIWAGKDLFTASWIPAAVRQGGKPAVTRVYSDVRCEIGRRERDVPGWTDRCYDVCFVWPWFKFNEWPHPIPAKGLGKDFFRKVIDTEGVETVGTVRVETRQHFVIEFTKCPPQSPNDLSTCD